VSDWIIKEATGGIKVLDTVATGLRTYNRTNRAGDLYLRDQEGKSQTAEQKKVRLALMKARLQKARSGQASGE